jgi:hypothetical protein
MKRIKTTSAAPVVLDLSLVEGGTPYAYRPSTTSASNRDAQPAYSPDPLLVRDTTERSSSYAYIPKKSSQSHRDSQPGERSYMASRYPSYSSSR